MIALTAVLPSVAQAGSSSAVGVVRIASKALPIVALRPWDGHAAALASWVAKAARVELASSSAAVAPPSARGFVVITPSLSGRSSDDALEVRFAGEGSVVARRGDTGSPLWTRSVPGVVAFDRAAVGAGRQRAVLAYGLTRDSAGQLETTVTALRASDGLVLWSASRPVLSERAGATGTVTLNVTFVCGILRQSTGDRVLLLDYAENYTPSGVAVAGRVEVLDAADGHPVAVGPPVAATDGVAMAAPLGDVNGDGTADWLVAASGSTYDVEAQDGATGRLLWRESGQDRYVVAQAGEDLNADHKPDVVLQLVSYLVDDAPPTVIQGVDGSNGSVLWSRNGDLIIPMTGEVAVIATTSDGSAATIAYMRDHATPYLSRTVRRPSCGYNIWDFELAGDVDGDHARDLVVSHLCSYYKSRPDHFTATLLAHRATLITQPYAPPGWIIPLQSSLDRHGDDIVTASQSTAALSLSVRDGLRGTTMWTRKLRPGFLGYVSAGPLFASGGPGLVETDFNSGGTVCRAFDAAGRLRWTFAI